MPISGRLLWAVCLAVGTIGVASQFYYLPHHDMAWLLYAAEQVIHGQALYGALVEVNPPLIVDLSELGVRIAWLFDVPRSRGWVIFTALQLALSFWLVARLLVTTLDREAPDLRYPLLAVVAWTLACLPAREFGQREHLIYAWLLPYVVSALNRGHGHRLGWPLAFTMGVLIALAICLKPYYAVLVLLIELVCVVWPTRSIRPLFRTELVMTGVLGVAYVAFVRWRYPLFFEFVLPLAVQYYGAYGSTLLGLIKPVHLVYGTATVIALAMTRTPRVAVRLAVAFAVAGLGAYVTLIVQSKGWSYHFLPTKAFLTIALATSALAVARRVVPSWLAGRPAWLPRAVATTAALLLVVTSLAWTVHQVRKHRAGRDYRIVRQFEAFFDRKQDRPETLVALSPSMFPGFPLVEVLRSRWGIRFNHLWMLPGLLQQEAQSPPASARALTMTRLSTLIAEDIDASKPAYIIVERRARIPTGFVDVLGIMLPNERFSRAWRSYVLVENVSGFEVYGRTDYVASVLHARPPSPTGRAQAVGR